MFASLRYINTHHAYASIPTQPDQNPFPVANGASTIHADLSTTQSQPGPETQSALESSGGAGIDPGRTPQQQQSQPQQQQQQDAGIDTQPTPDPPAVFTSSLKELARDLVLKEQQIEFLVRVLPGIGTSEQQQTERIRVLEDEMRVVIAARQDAERRRDEAVGRVEELAGRCRRVV